MIIYWILLLIPMFLATYSQINNISRNFNFYLYVFFYFILTFVIGFRHQVGGDWHHYVIFYDIAKNQTFLEVINSSDPAYGFLNWLSATFNFGPYFVNLICASIFSLGLIIFCKQQPNPWLSLTVSIPYLVIVVAMGYTRQSVAIGLVMISLVHLKRNNFIIFLLFIFISALFHKSSLILLPLYFFSGKNNLFTVFGIIFIGFFLYLLLLAEHVESLFSGYILDRYDSSGAAVRVFMNAIPAAFFLLFRKRFNLPNNHLSFWTWLSFFALLFIPLLLISPSSTAVDRVALYLIPLQLFIWGRLPFVLSKKGKLVYFFVVFIYSFLVQFIWLFFAHHKDLWLPYVFYPIYLLWNF